MQCTDACVHPYPGGDSSVRRMALEARELGFDSIVAVGAESGTLSGVGIIGGRILQGTQVREIQAGLKKNAPGSVITMVNAGDYAFNRAVMNLGGIRILKGVQASPKNSFDHILARIAAERNIAVDLDFAPVFLERGYARQKALHRYADLVRLQDRFGFPFTLSSGARSVLEMRSTRQLVALGALFGLDEKGIHLALRGVTGILCREKPVEVVG